MSTYPARTSAVVQLLALLAAVPLFLSAPLAGQASCSAPDAPGMVALRRIIGAVNSGQYPAIRQLLTDVWAPAALANGRQAEAIYELGTWHWRSRSLRVELLCGKDRRSAFALLRNGLSEELDSLDVVIDTVTGRVERHFIREGVRTFVAPTDLASDATRMAAVRRITHRLADAGVFAGTIIVARDGKPIYVDSLGESNRATHRRVRLADQFSIASTGKLFTATALMTLREAGRLTLDDPLGSILPDSILGPSDERYFRVSQAVRAVPLKYVLSHTSGINPDQDSLASVPGTRYSYCNYCYFLLGRGLERLTGQPLEAFYRKALFEPAGMTRTVRVVTKRPLATLPPNYMEEFDSLGFRLIPNALIQGTPANGAGNFFSTTPDLLRFVEALRAGKLVPLETVRAMRTPKVEFGAREYGYGMDLRRGPGIWGHDGDLPGADSDVEIYGDSGYVLVLLSNVDGVNNPIRRKVAALLAGRTSVGSPRWE